MNEWVEAFTLFAAEGVGNFDICAEHDVIYVSAPLILSTSRTGLRLTELRWHKDEDGAMAREEDPTHGIDEDTSWYHYC